MHHATQNPSMQTCIDNCLECHRVCLATVAHCLAEGGKHADGAHIALLLSCAAICQTSAQAMLLGSDSHRHSCKACAEICRQCATACVSVADDEAMKACAVACADCAGTCQQMAC